VLPEAVIDREIPGQQEVPLDGILEALRVSPLVTDGRAKLFWFAVRAGVYGLVRMCLSPRTLKAFASLREM